VQCRCCREGSGAQPRREAVWLDSADLMCCVDMPLLVLCSPDDVVTPALMVRAIFQASPAVCKTLAWVAETSHDTIMLSGAYWRELQRFLQELLDRSRAAEQQQQQQPCPKWREQMEGVLERRRLRERELEARREQEKREQEKREKKEKKEKKHKKEKKENKEKKAL